MRKFFLLLLLLMLLFITPALAQTYSFSNIHASIDVPESEYDVVLTGYNLSTQSSWIAEQGMDFDLVENEFENEGILLKAYDTKNSRVFVLTALEDLDAKTYFDLNRQDENMRKEFRLSHTNGTAYGVLGYTYFTAKWQNYGENALRFLKTSYSLRENGQQVCSGYQRRTIRNGYTITLDMQVAGSAKDADDKALEALMKTFRFTEVLPMPELPLKLSFTSAPPAETNEATFVVKGTTAKKAAVTATVFSLGAAGSETFTETASSSGSFSIKVKLPSAGAYSVTITAQADDAIPAQRMFSVVYQPGILPIELTATPNATLSDKTIISGTTIAGAKAQIAVSGPVEYQKKTTGKAFSFTVDTSAEGEYTFILSVTKKGMEERLFTYHGTRAYTDSERLDHIRASAQKMTYANLSKPQNKGVSVVLTGTILDIQENTGEYIVKFAMKKSGEIYKEILYAISADRPAFSAGDTVKMYGTADETYSRLSEGNTVENYPRVIAVLFEAN